MKNVCLKFFYEIEDRISIKRFKVERKSKFTKTYDQFILNLDL